MPARRQQDSLLGSPSYMHVAACIANTILLTYTESSPPLKPYRLLTPPLFELRTIFNAKLRNIQVIGIPNFRRRLSLRFVKLFIISIQ
jgi:hypothetical protein